MNMAKTSDNIRPCNIGQSEAHNRRTPQYLAHINKRNIYLRPDLMAANEAWVSPRIEGVSLGEYYKYIGEMVKAKTGRAMQTKDRTRLNKKTGKTVTVRGSTPIKEGVVVCKANTTMEQLQRWGTVLRALGHHAVANFYPPRRGALRNARRRNLMEAELSCPYRMGLDEPRYGQILQTHAAGHE